MIFGFSYPMISYLVSDCSDGGRFLLEWSASDEVLRW